MKIDELLEKLEGVQARGSGWVALCPAHEDSTPSLSVDETDDGNLLLKCHAGCTFESIAKAVGMGGERKPVATYDYTDAGGELLYQVLRYEPKSFRQRQPDGQGGWIWSMDGAKRVPYRLAEVLEASKRGDFVFITEGEKDADAIKKAGYVATCSVGGSSSWKKDYAQHLRGAQVVIWPDNDEPGHAYARDIKKSLQGVAKSIAAVQSLQGKDAFDHLEVHKLAINLVVPAEIRDASDETALSEVDAKSVEWHLEPFVQVAAFHLLAGDGGVGKGSWLAHLIAQVTTGKTERGGKPQNVLVVASEDSAEVDLKPRVLAAGGDPSKVFVLRKHVLLPRDIDYLEEKIEQQRKGHSTGVVILDPISNHIGGASGDDESAVRKAINELNFVAERTGCTIFGVRHTTKSSEGGVKAILGSVAWVNSPRVILMLERLSNGSWDTGSRVLRVVKSNRGQKGREKHYALKGIRIPEVENEVPLIVPEFSQHQSPAPEVVPSKEASDDPWFQQT
jgi:5S rRNA maturation endonuclease (ribonuclease M5)